MRLTVVFLFCFFSAFAQPEPFSFNKKQKEVLYKYMIYDVNDLTIKRNYSYRKHDSLFAHKNVYQYLQHNFKSIKVDTTLYGNRIAYKTKIVLNTNQFIDSIKCDFRWFPEKDFLRFGLFDFSIIQNGKIKTVKEYLLKSTKKEQQFLFDCLLEELEKIEAGLRSTNDYNLTDLDFIHYYSAHSRFEKFPNDSISEIREFEITRDSLCIDKYKLHEDTPLDSQNLSFLKRFVLSFQHNDYISLCSFEPHHYFVFYDIDKKEVGKLIVCFQCNAYRLQIDSLTIKINRPFFEEDKRLLVGYFKKQGIRNVE
jgi:hypothetical protein